MMAQVRITEMLPAGSKYLDDDGSPQGWIELWNPDQNHVATLTGYRLNDGTTTWTFPNIQMMPDERIIIWTSAKNRTAATAPLHTNFVLPAEGGTLSLSDASNNLLSRLQDAPALPENISWGRDEWDTAVTPAATGFYASPTPGERNNFTGAGVSGQVTADVRSRSFTGSLSVALTTGSATPGTVIRYTTDRSIPTAASTEYTAPISITNTTMLRARAFSPGLLPGATATEGYLLLDATAANFSSTMPLVVVSNFLNSPPPADKSHQSGFMWVWQPAFPGATVRLTDTPAVTSRVRLNRRGSSTLNNPKFNLSIEARNAYDDDERDVPMLGMKSHSDWILHAPYSYDRALLRNPFIHDLSNQLGHWAPHHRMAEVFLDFSSTGLRSSGTTNEYFGIYNILEKVNRGKDRMNLTKLNPYDNDAAKKTGGYIWKIDRSDSSAETFTAGGFSQVYDYPKAEALKSPQRDPQEQYLTQYLNAFNAAVTSANKDPVTGYPSYLEITETIDHHLLNVWAFNVDGLRLSAYWHKDRGGKFAAGPTWDFDRSMSSTDGRDANPNQWRASTGDLGTDFFNGSADSRRWWHHLFRDPDFYQQYIDRWQELRRGSFSPANVNSLLDSINSSMSVDAVARDLTRWGRTKRAWTSPFTSQVHPASQAAEVQRIKDFLQQRANFFDSQWVGGVTASVPPGRVSAGTTVTLTGPAGAAIHYTLDGSDPRPAGGNAPSLGTVHLYTSAITISDLTRIRARAYKGDHTALTGANRPPLVSKWGGPADLSYTTRALPEPGNVTITEINQQPAPPAAAELALDPALTSNSFEFIELRNIGTDSLELAGSSTTAGITFTFPESTPALAPGQYLILAANPAAFSLRYPGVSNIAGPWSGDLANDGETLTLTGPGGSTIISITYAKAWSSLAAGGNHTLVAYDEMASTGFGTEGNWRTSAIPGGSPGHHDPRSKRPPTADILLHYWNFNTTEPTMLNPTRTLGGGAITITTAPPDTFYLSGTGQVFSGDNARGGDPAGSHLRVNYPIASVATFSLPTIGHRDITIRYDTRRSGSGAGTQKVAYTLDGTTYQPFATIPVTDGTPGTETLDFTTVPGASANPHFGIRITFEQGAGGTVGNNRFDNLTLEGIPISWIPEELLRYALGVPAGQPTEGFLPVISSPGGGLRFHFDPAKTDIVYRVQRSTTLSGWTAVFDSRTDEWQPHFDGGWLQFTDPDPPPGKAFYRLQVVHK
jgi:hypothetical protein